MNNENLRNKLDRKIREVLGQKNGKDRETARENHGFDMGDVRILKVEEDPNFKQSSSRTKHQEFVQGVQTIINIGSIGDKDYGTYRDSSSPKRGNSSPKRGNNVTIVNNGKVGESKTRNYGTVNGNVTIKDGKLYYEDGTEVELDDEERD